MITTLLALLLEPTLRKEHVERQRSVVAVLVDRSDSMALRDRWTDPAARRALARWAGVRNPSDFPRLEWAVRAVGLGSGQPDRADTRADWLRHRRSSSADAPTSA